MPVLPEQFVITDLTIRLVVLLVVIIIERHFSLNEAYHPATLYRYIAHRLAKKVNKRSPRQQIISSMLSGGIMFALPLALVIIVLSIANIPWFFEAFFLLLALHCRPLFSTCTQLIVSLGNQRKNLAREQLSALCIRDTNTLSVMGITKAAIESVVQRSIQNYFSIIIYYAIFGIYAAVTAAAINALAKYWNPKQQTYRYFGQLFSTLAKWLNLPIMYLMTLNLGLLFGIKYITFSYYGWHNKSAGALLTTTANILKRELGGAVIYDGTKIRRPKLGPNTSPQIDDIGHIVTILQKLQISTLIVITFSLATNLILTNI